MIKKILSFFGFGKEIYNITTERRRKHIRHPGFRAEVIVGNRVYSIRDWSLGGISFDTAADARIQTGDKVQMTMTFHLPHDTITIEQQARIVRAAKRGVAAAFTPLPPTTRRQFERVLDGLHAQGFLESQVA